MSEQTIWDLIAAPLDPKDIKTKTVRYKDKKTQEWKEFSTRYIDRTTVETLLNTVAPGLWHFQCEVISRPEYGTDGEWVVKGVLTIDGVTREDFGMNDNVEDFDPPKAAVSDAFKRCASLFGLGRELYRPAGAKTTATGRPTTPKVKVDNGDFDKLFPKNSPRPYSPAELKARFAEEVKGDDGVMADQKDVAALGRKLGISRIFTLDSERYEFASRLTGRPIAGFADLTARELAAIDKWAQDGKAASAEVAALFAET